MRLEPGMRMVMQTDRKYHGPLQTDKTRSMWPDLRKACGQFKVRVDFSLKKFLKSIGLLSAAETVSL